MKDIYQIQLNIANKRYKRRLKSKEKRKVKNRVRAVNYLKNKGSLSGNFNYENLIQNWLPANLSFLIKNDESPFFLPKIAESIPDNFGIFKVPEYFSIVEYPKESYEFIGGVIGALLLQKFNDVTIDYKDCKSIDISAQVLFDIVIIDILKFFRKCKKYKKTKSYIRGINGINIHNKEVKKLLFSVGSAALFSNKVITFPDIISYKLCVHDSSKNRNSVEDRKQKDIDTTNLVEYVISCMRKLNHSLSSEKIDDLSTIVGEILINAEEHSTIGVRFSIGYFTEVIEPDGGHYGVFRLAILNFGKTIYEKFKDPECPNKDIVSLMKGLSRKYTERKFFKRKVLEEETLWTLYALQEGVSSVDPLRYKKRGNGSIQFIDSFFNLKGRKDESDKESKMAILSGRTRIVFDGTYDITKRDVDGDQYKFMTFNDTGDINDKPDSEYVNFVPNYFPGTIISARILFKEENLKHNDYEIKQG